MSASITWQPVEANLHRLETNTPSKFLMEAEQVFGKLPLVLKKDNIQQVRTLAAIDATWFQVQEAIEQVGSIRLAVDY